MAGRPNEDSRMTPEQVEQRIVELIHCQRFVPFVVEMTGGQSLAVTHPRLVINGGGAGFIGPDGAIVDFEFNSVQAIRVGSKEAVA